MRKQKMQQSTALEWLVEKITVGGAGAAKPQP